jgi:hypothetical protein
MMQHVPKRVSQYLSSSFPPFLSLYSCRMAAWFEITFPITRTVAMVFANRLSLPMSSSSRSRVRAAQAVTKIDLAAVLFLWKPARLLAVAGRVGDDQVDHLCASAGRRQGNGEDLSIPL